ncbi:hypothetical protein A2U01_0047219, partial [Trifolium medium]|nr:hypothetical protein [Trifolium medium]
SGLLAQRDLARISERSQKVFIFLARISEDQRESRYSSLVLAQRRLKNTALARPRCKACLATACFRSVQHDGSA